MVADDPENKIALKTFHCEILYDHKALKEEEDSYKDIAVIRKIDNSMVQKNYLQIKQDIQYIIHAEIDRLMNDPALTYLVIKK
jgi:hypothetical protein